MNQLAFRHVLVLGGGRVGRAAALDLRADMQVTVLDPNPRDPEGLTSRGVRLIRGDASDPATLRQAAEGCDVALCAVPGSMGLRTLERLIGLGLPIVDVSFMPEDPSVLDGLAKQAGVPVLTDVGIAPGYMHMIAGYETTRMKVHRFECLVGGLPAKPTWPMYYQSPFSPIDVVEEYIRPARLRRNGQDIERPALSEPERIPFGELGELEAINTDGLRSLLSSYPDIPEMVEKTLRYPAHADLMRVFAHCGFFSETPVTVDGQSVRPLSLTAELLIQSWAMGPEDEDITVMRCTADGDAGGPLRRVVYEIHDRYDRSTRTLSMARATGYTTTATLRALGRGFWSAPGVYPPERLGEVPGLFAFVTEELRARGLSITVREQHAPA